MTYDDSLAWSRSSFLIRLETDFMSEWLSPTSLALLPFRLGSALPTLLPIFYYQNYYYYYHPPRFNARTHPSHDIKKLPLNQWLF